MKAKKLFVVFLIACGSAQLLAQEDNTVRNSTSSWEARRKLVFGVKVGINKSNVYDQNAYRFVADAKRGGVGGVFMAIPLGGFLGFQPELLYSQKGFVGSGEMNGEVYHITRTSNFLDVPLQLQIKPFGFLTFLGGIQYSYLLSQRDEISSDGNYARVDQTFNNDDLRRNILGAVMGADFNLRHLVLSARAGWDLMANNSDGSSTTPQYKNLWLQATLGYRFY